MAKNIMSVVESMQLTGGSFSTHDDRYTSKQTDSDASAKYECFDNCNCQNCGSSSDCLCTNCQHCED